MERLNNKLVAIIEEAQENKRIYRDLAFNSVGVLDEYIQNNNQDINTWQDFQDSKSTFRTFENQASLTDEVEDGFTWKELFDVEEEEYDKYKYFEGAVLTSKEVNSLITELQKLL